MSRLKSAYFDQCFIAIDCSLHSISICIVENKKISAEITIDQDFQTSQLLLRLIDRTLNDAQVDKKSLQAICVTNGPGSFTALRISLASVSAISLSLDIPVFTVDSFQIIAEPLSYLSKSLLIIQKGYQNTYFCGRFLQEGQTLKKQSLLGIKQDAILDYIMNDEIVITSDQSIIEQVQKEKGNHQLISYPFTVPKAHNIAFYFLKAERVEPSALPLEPIYLLQPEAERNYKRG